MGVQQISEKKTREAALTTGLPIFRALRHSNRLWFGFCYGPVPGITGQKGHWHVEFDPVTGEWWLPRSQGGFSSCADDLWGPHVDPPKTIVSHDEWRRRALTAEASNERVMKTLDFYAAPNTYETQENWAAIHAGSLETYIPIDDDKGALARAAKAAEEE